MDITLKFGKNEVKCNLGLEFVGELIEVTDLSIEEIGEKMQKNPFKFIPVMLNEAHKAYYAIEGKDPVFTKRQLINFLEDDGGISSKEMTRFMTEWTKSMTKGVPKSDVSEGGEAEEPKK